VSDAELVIHHLNLSRSTRIVWLAEELGVPYELTEHRRDATMRAPASLGAVHPLGKAPVIEIDGIVVAESGAIVELLCERAGRLAPAPGTPERSAFLEWLHFAEGSAMMPIIIELLSMFMGEGATAGVTPFFAPERGRVLSHLEQLSTALNRRGIPNWVEV